MPRCLRVAPPAAHHPSWSRRLQYQSSLIQAARRLRVAMDMTLLEGREGGSAVYARSLVNALSAIDDVQVTIVSAGTAGGLATAAWMLSGARVALRAEGAAVLHSPAFLTPLNPPIPTVITIHDQIGRAHV